MRIDDLHFIDLLPITPLPQTCLDESLNFTTSIEIRLPRSVHDFARKGRILRVMSSSAPSSPSARRVRGTTACPS